MSIPTEDRSDGRPTNHLGTTEADKLGATEADKPGNKENPTIKINHEALKQLVEHFDETHQLEIQYVGEFWDKVMEVLQRQTAMYEKLMIADGAAIALSITFLSSLSAHLTAGHVVQRPHLWMVTVAWSLLVISIFSSYRVLGERNQSTMVLLAKVSLKQTTYLHQRLQNAFTRLSGAFQGEVPVEGQVVDLSKLFGALAKFVDESGKQRSKEIGDYIKQIKEASIEGPLANIAMFSAIVGILFLCIFVMGAVSLLF